jgi:hypothetical protein
MFIKLYEKRELHNRLQKEFPYHKISELCIPNDPVIRIYTFYSIYRCVMVIENAIGY